MRHTHVVKQVGAGQWQETIIVVQAAVKQQYESDADAMGHMELSGFAMDQGHISTRRIAWSGMIECTKEGGFWPYLYGSAARHRNILIVSLSAREVMAALDLWGQISRHELTLWGADQYAKPAAHNENDPRRNGVVILEGPPTIVQFRRLPHECTFTWIDLANWGIGNVYGQAGVEVNYGGEIVPLPNDVWCDDRFLKDQVNAVKYAIQSYLSTIEELRLGAPQNTAASQAMTGFRHAYMSHDIEIHDSIPVLELERKALYGGRCEATFIGDIHAGEDAGVLYKLDFDQKHTKFGVGPIYHLDANSMYPSVASELFVPTRLRSVVQSPNMKAVREATRQFATVGHYQINTATPCVPAVHGNNTIYPVGLFDTYLCGPELLLALSEGAQIRCTKLVVYDAKPIYRQWALQLYKARREFAEAGDKPMADCVKAILNASFGKWAQQSKRWVSVPDRDPPAPYTQWLVHNVATDKLETWRSLCWDVQKLTIIGETPESFPAITAYINSAGRVQLWRWLNTAGRGNVYYYDTDSVWCNQEGYDNLSRADAIDNHELGKLKIKAVHSHLRIHGRQAYEADGELKLSGCGEKSVSSGDAFAIQLKIPPIQHYLLKDQPPGLDRHTSRIQINRPYVHGHVQYDGSVLPVRFE